MQARGIQPADFEKWIEEERSYLESLKKEPDEEVAQMMYYEQLVKLDGAR